MKPVTLLLVDDEPINLMVMANALEDEYRLLSTRSGTEAVRLARENPVDLILLDVMMPEQSGYQTLAQLRNCPETSHIPVIFVTALKDTASEREGIGLGAVDFISKPFDMGVLRLRVANQVELANYRRSLEQQVVERSREITELKLAAERESQAKTVFIRSLYDCLNNPLTAIIGFSQLLQYDSTPDEIIEYGKQIHDAGELISSLVDPMLSYTGLDNEVICRERGLTSVRDLIYEVVDLLAFVAQERQVKVCVSAESDALSRVSHDYLRSALREVVRNAILYSPAGSTVSLVLTIDSGTVRIEVRDQGPGIPLADIPAAMFPFNRLGKPLGKEGLGLGLAVVHRTLDALALPFGLENQAEGGLCCWMELQQHH